MVFMSLLYRARLKSGNESAAIALWADDAGSVGKNGREAIRTPEYRSVITDLVKKSRRPIPVRWDPSVYVY